jgi:hypothetical protein
MGPYKEKQKQSSAMDMNIFRSTEDKMGRDGIRNEIFTFYRRN